MTPTERIGFFLFVATVAAVFVAAAGTVVRIAGERIRRRPQPATAFSGVGLDVGAARLWIAGVAVEHEALTQQALDAAPPGAFTVFLEHDPDDVEPVAHTGRVDLYCAGHTHGGQVALPGYGAILTLSRSASGTSRASSASARRGST